MLSLWTTSYARSLLHFLMQCVAETPGCKILYTDTDSIIFVHPVGKCPLRTGVHLGELTNEFPAHDIIEWVSGGSKQYGLKLRRKSDGKIEHVIKMRGITLNFDVMTNQKLQYETFKSKVLEFVRDGIPTPMTVHYPRFIRPNIVHGSVYSQSFSKVVKPVVSKGITNAQTCDVQHFGFI